MVDLGNPGLFFLSNGFWVIDPSRAAREKAERGIPEGVAPFFRTAGRIAQILAGAAYW